MLQHIASEWSNVRNMLCPTMLQDVALKCCERLARPFKATNNGLQQKLHLLPSDINILLTVVLCTTLKPNGNSLVTFSILVGYGFNKPRERIEHLECICVYCCLAIYFVHSFQVKKKKKTLEM